MNKTLSVLALAAGIVCAGHRAASADNSPQFAFMTGTHLMEMCSSGYPNVVSACSFYIMGIADALEDGETTIGGWTGCVPNFLTGEQTRYVVMAWYWRHSESWKHNAARVVARALNEMFPCATTARPKFNG